MEPCRKREHQVPLAFLSKIDQSGEIARLHTRGLFGEHMSIVFQSEPGSGWNGEPSYSTIVAPVASTLASQFHIIQPHVVK